MTIYTAEPSNSVCTVFVGTAFRMSEFSALPGSSTVPSQTGAKDNKQLQEGGVLILKGSIMIWYVQTAQEVQTV